MLIGRATSPQFQHWPRAISFKRGPRSPSLPIPSQPKLSRVNQSQPGCCDLGAIIPLSFQSVLLVSVLAGFVSSHALRPSRAFPVQLDDPVALCSPLSLPAPYRVQPAGLLPALESPVHFSPVVSKLADFFSTPTPRGANFASGSLAVDFSPSTSLSASVHWSRQFVLPCPGGRQQ
jgi:hypothetical protein